MTPGQGQAVTIAGAKIGEVASVDLKQGLAVVTMKVVPKYARIYRNATLLLRPKTPLEDITIEVNPARLGGRLQSGEMIPVEQTAPNINFDEFLAGLDGETRAYLQELLAGAGEGLNHNGRALAATLKRFQPAARYGRRCTGTHDPSGQHERSIHNFRLLVQALGGKDEQLAELVDASNAVFATSPRRTRASSAPCSCCPARCARPATDSAARALPHVLGSTLHKLGRSPRARAGGRGDAATR